MSSAKPTDAVPQARVIDQEAARQRTWALLRRVMTNASLVAAVDIAGGMVSHAILTNPFAQKIAGEVAGAAVASQRMYRLGRISGAACRLFPKRSGKEE